MNQDLIFQSDRKVSDLSNIIKSASPIFPIDCKIVCNCRELNNKIYHEPHNIFLASLQLKLRLYLFERQFIAREIAFHLCVNRHFLLLESL